MHADTRNMIPLSYVLKSIVLAVVRMCSCFLSFSAFWAFSCAQLLFLWRFSFNVWMSHQLPLTAKAKLPLWLILAHLHDEHCLFMRKITKRKTKQAEGSEKTGSYVKNDRKPLNASVLSFTQLSKAGWLSAVRWLVLVSNAKLLHFQKKNIHLQKYVATDLF